MRIILKNLLTTLRRYPTSVLLNIGGLSVAFTAFVIIMMQVGYEYSFDRDMPGAERVFRVELGYYDRYQTVLDHPLIDELSTVSAHIEAASLLESNSFLDVNVRVERTNGMQDVFRLQRLRATPAIVPVLGLELIEGDASTLDAGGSVLMPESMARRMFPGEQAAGHKLVGPDADLTVGGVYRDFPANSVFPNNLIEGHPWKNIRGNSNYMFFVRLDDPAAAEEVRQAMERAVHAYYGDREGDLTRTIRMVEVRDLYFERDVSYESLSPKGNRTTTDILFAIAVLVIVIASINFINFASALTPIRMKMINLQKILGAGVWQLRASLLVESAAVALAAYAVAIALVASLGGTSFTEYVTADISLGANLPLVGRCALVALLVGLAAGLYPAFYMTSFRPILAVRGSFGTSATGRRYRMVLVGLQYVISLALIIATLFVNLQNRYLTRLEMGYDKEQIVVVDLTQDVLTRRDAFVAQLKSYSGIEDVAFAFQKFGAEEANYMGWGRSYRDGEDISFKALLVSDNFLRTLGIPVTEGRGFRPSDALREPASYVFNDLARERYSMELGEYVAQNDLDAEGRHTVGWGEIVGFLPRNVRLFSQHMAEEPLAFLTLGTLAWEGLALHFCYIRVSAGTNLMEATDHIRRTLQAVSPFDHDIEFMDSVVNSLYRSELRAGVLVTLFSVLAILISLMGVFGLVLFETQYRRKEIGIRKVNGATAASILGMFNLRFAAIVLVSFLIAAPAAWYGVGVWMRGFVSAVPLSAWVFAAALAIVLAITVLTVTVRSWRAADENPVKSVKTE